MQTLQRYAYLFIIVPVFLFDRWTKVLIEDHLAFGESWQITSWLSLVHWQNKGGLFGFMADDGSGRLVFLVIPVAIIAGLVYYLVIYRPSLLLRLAFVFILAGAVGNMYDRLFYGYVIDFVDVRVYGSYHWPAFNVADSSITFGISLWLFIQVFAKGTAKGAVGRKSVGRRRLSPGRDGADRLQGK